MELEFQYIAALESQQHSDICAFSLAFVPIHSTFPFILLSQLFSPFLPQSLSPSHFHCLLIIDHCVFTLLLSALGLLHERLLTLSSQQPYEVDAIINLILQIENQGTGKLINLCKGYIVYSVFRI